MDVLSLRKTLYKSRYFGVEGQLGELGVPLTKVRQTPTNIILDLFSSKKGTQWRQNFLGAGAIRGDTGTPNQSLSEPYQYYTPFLQLEESNTMVDKFWGLRGN